MKKRIKLKKVNSVGLKEWVTQESSKIIILMD